jgi:hypothetical protein
MRPVSLLTICLLCLFGTCRARAVETVAASPVPNSARTIWSALVLATNASHPAEAPAQLRKYERKLKNIFGYNQFELIGENGQTMIGPLERLLTPSKDFSLSVKAHGEHGQSFPAKVVIFQNRRRLVEFEAHLGAESPLFIRGPQYAGGQLIIVLHVVEPSEPAPHAAATPLLARSPNPLSAASATKEKPNPAPVIPVSQERVISAPAERSAPDAAEKLSPVLGQKPGDLDARPIKP